MAKMKAKTKARGRNVSYARLTPADKEAIRQRIDAGETRQSISDEFGITCHQVKYLAASRSVGRQIPLRGRNQDIRAESAAMKIAALEAEVARLRSGSDRLPVTCKAKPGPTIQERWLSAEAESKIALEKADNSSRFAINFDSFESGKPVAIAFISDQHIGPGTPCDMERMRLDAELIAKTDGLYAILGGDGVDNHIRITSAMLAARSQPSDQWDLFEHYLSIFAHKIICLIDGNHDAWTNQIAGVDMTSVIARQQNICYAPAAASITASYGGIDYKIVMRHQSRMNSTFNQTHCVKQLFRNGEEEFDIGVVGHHHEAALEMFMARGLPRWAARPGSYQRSSAYSHRYAFNRATPTCPTFFLWPGERRISGWYNVWDAVDYLPAIR